jgi:hypothetical protein
MSNKKRSIIALAVAVVLGVVSAFVPGAAKWIEEVNETVDEVQKYNLLDEILRETEDYERSFRGIEKVEEIPNNTKQLGDEDGK